MGVTQQVPIDERHVYSELYLINRIKTLLGGRAAEELVFDHHTTGASNDLMAATEIANRMVCEWGMNVMVGPLSYLDAPSGFLGNVSIAKKYSEQTAQLIDGEMHKLIEKCYGETLALLQKNNKLLHKLAEVLLVHETVDAEELDIVISCVITHTEENKS
jgi:cell division protease FtsH